MAYFGEVHGAAGYLSAWLDLRHEQGQDVKPLVDEAVRRLQGITRKVEKLGPPPKAGEEVLILPGTEHRFWAEDRPFHMLVVSFGEWLAEDQERMEDDYGREGQQVVL